VERIPPPRVRAKRTRLDRTALLVVTKRGRVLLEKQPEGGLFGGLWTVPMLEGKLEPDAALDEAARRYGLSLDGGRVAGDVKNVLTHRDLFVRVVRTTDAPRRAKKPLLYAKLSRLSGYGMPTVAVRVLRAGLSPEELVAAELPDRARSRVVFRTKC
jgi:A/G-specific adenine glycosylase